MSDRFAACEICGTRAWTAIHTGTVRDGRFGSTRDGAVVARCGGCGVERLAEDSCIPDSFYLTDAYRQKLEQDIGASGFVTAQDEMARFSIEALDDFVIRGITLADVGCGAGAFLDRISGLAARAIAVEPTAPLRARLADRYADCFAFAEEASAKLGPVCDLATSFQVIEHVADPVAFLAGIRGLLKRDGRAVLTTPNRADILMDLCPDPYRTFFYRTVHRWYFDAASLAVCAQRAGFEVEAVRYVQRYPMSNFLLWLRDRRPSGGARLAGIDGSADAFWKAHLESSGQADCLAVILRVRSGA